MARTCFYCEKRRLVGNNVSHANNKTKKVSLPNLQKIRVLLTGTTRRVYACTRCIRSGLAQKAA